MKPIIRLLFVGYLSDEKTQQFTQDIRFRLPFRLVEILLVLKYQDEQIRIDKKDRWSLLQSLLDLKRLIIIFKLQLLQLLTLKI